MSPTKSSLPASRWLTLQAAIIFVFILLGYGFWRLQILHYGKYNTLALDNRIRRVMIPAPRGIIEDRHGRILVENRPSFHAILEPRLTHHLQRDLPAIAQGLQLQLPQWRARVRHPRSKYATLTIKTQIDSADVAFIESHQNQFPELRLLMVTRRVYPAGGWAAALLGYVGQANPAQARRWHLPLGTVVGKAGIEEYYNRYLLGVPGEERIVVNSLGHVVGQLKDIPPITGHTLRLTIDSRLQTAAEAAMGQRNGAIVALNPRNGQVLAMVSRPGYNPNHFVHGISVQQWHRLITNPEHPLLNKAIQAQLAPGSVFKLRVAAAGLQTGIAQNFHVNCTGGAVFYGHYFHCWVPRGHGEISLVRAISQSCDVFFYTLGNRLGINTIARYARRLGLGRATGIDLPQEAEGLIPTPAWKMRRYHQPWWPGETIPVAIGQGPLLVTPLQLAHTIGGILEGGLLYRPHLVFRGEIPSTFEPRALRHASSTPVRFPLHTQTVQMIQAGMAGVVQPGGTAHSAYLPGIPYGAKTGTAQTVSEAYFQHSGDARRWRNNAWFVGAYPLQNPRLIVCVLYERGAEGYFAGEIAAKVIAAYAYEHPRLRAAASTVTGNTHG